jgi:hypothetical protein
MTSGEFEKARQAHQSLMDGERALKKADATTALAAAEKAETLNPGFYRNASLRGRALLLLQRNEEGCKALEAALASQPAFQSEKVELEDLLKQAQGNK